MRLHHSVVATIGLLALAACGGSGFAGSPESKAPDAVSLSTTSGMADDFAVVPGGSSPLAIAAIAYAGSGVAGDVVPGVTYTWSARFENPLTDPAHGTYTVGSAPNGFRPCPAVPAETPAVPILTTGTPGTASTLYSGFQLLPAGATAREVYVGPVPGATPPYCLVVTASSVPGNVPGSATVIVSASP